VTVPLGTARAMNEPAPRSLLLPGEAESVARARVFITTTLAKWRATPASSDDARLMVSEVVTNAVMYSDGDIELCIRRHGDVAHIEVHDESSSQPNPGDPGRAGAHGGWGLLIVQALAASWGIEQIEHDGKIVWFEISVR
jgi:anti-sigma regulatory factor (Ser/Thr protein kinase)